MQRGDEGARQAPLGKLGLGQVSPAGRRVCVAGQAGLM